MYSIDTSFVAKGRKTWIEVIAICFFIFVLINGFVIYINYKMTKMDKSVVSTLVEVETYDDEDGTMYHPIYYFRYNGKQYACKTAGSSSYYPNTKNGTVWFSSKDPTDCVTEDSKFVSKITLLFSLIPLVFMGVGVYNLIKIGKRIKEINKLNQSGKLIKGLEFSMQQTGVRIGKNNLCVPVVNYEVSPTQSIKLTGDPRYDFIDTSSIQTIDLIIDESNPKNCFMDFNINRISGNLESDYYKKDNIN
jgi:hypothetical protein